MTSNKLSQTWRFVRLFAVTFGGTLATTANATGIHGHLSSKVVASAVIGAAVPAVEVAYRQVWPPTKDSKVVAFFTAVRQAYKSLGTPPSGGPGTV